MTSKNTGKQSWKDLFQPIQLLFDQLNDAIFMLDHKGTILSLNHSACQLTGYQKKEIVGKTVNALFLNHSETLEFLDTMLHSDMSPTDTESKKLRVDFVSRNGQKIPIEVSHFHFPQLKEHISCVIARNISEQKVAETLRETSFALSSTLNPVDVFDHLLIEMRKLIPYDGGNVMVVGEKSVHITRTLGYDAYGETLSTLVNSLQFDPDTTENIRTIIDSHQPLILPDTSKVSYWNVNDASSNFRSWIGVPVIIDDKVDAVLSLDKVEPDFFTEDHASILMIFASQAASAIKNARMFEAEARRIQQLDGLQSTLKAINSQLELSILLKEIVAKAINLLNATTGELALYDPDQKELKRLVSQSLTKNSSGKFQQIVDEVFTKVASTKKAIKIDRNTENIILSKYKDQDLYPGMAVPLLSGDELLGVLGIADLKTKRVFNEADINLLTTFAQQATIAIKNSRLFEEAKRQAEEAETLRKAGAVVSSSLNQTQAIDLILEQLAMVVPYDIAAVLLKEKDNLTIVGGRGFNNMRFTLGKNIKMTDVVPATEVFTKRVALNFGNIPAEFPIINVDSGATQEIQSWLGAPLIIQGRAIGVIFLNSYQPKRFNQDHVRLIAAFADQVAIALDNARLYTGASRSAKRFETLYHLSQIISSNLRIEDIYPAVHQAVTELMDTEFFCISLYDADTQMIHDTYMIDKGVNQPLTSRPLEKGLFATVLKTGKSLLFDTFDETTKIETGALMTGDLDDPNMSQSILIVPLNIGSNRIGVLSAQSYQPHMYSKDDREILELLASNVAIAIENARLFEEVRQLAITDPLTQLFNRRKFEELSFREFERSRRYHRPLCVIMIDLDQFKLINDTHGHLAGDQALVTLATTFKQSLRTIDTLARVGGEEFAVLLPETAAIEALATAERLRKGCEQLDLSSSQGDIYLTISLGVAELDDACLTLAELVDRADHALYASKRSGRNRSTLWAPNLEQPHSKHNHTPMD